MNKSNLKSTNQLQPKAISVKQPLNKPSLKRKNIDEGFNRNVRSKIESSSARTSDEVQIKIQLKKGPISSSQPLVKKENVSKSLNKSNILPKSNPKSDNVLNAIEKSLQKFGSKPKVVNPNIDKNKKTVSQPINDQKAQNKAILKARLDELMKAVKHFDEKKGVLSNLKELSEKMENDCNPAFEACTEKYKQIEKEFEARKIEQAKELEALRAKIMSLEAAQQALSLSLVQKKANNEKLSEEKKETENNVKTYEEFIENNSVLLSQLLHRNEDLRSFIINKSNSLEEAIRTTREKVKTRNDEISAEEKKALILEELLHSKKQNVRTFLFLRGPRFHNESHPSDVAYRIHAHDNTRRIRVELNKIFIDNNPKFYEFDSIYHVNGYQNREDNIFCGHDLKLYRNIVESIFETEQKANYVFIMLYKDEFTAHLFKQLFNMILETQVDNLSVDELNISQKVFDNQGKINFESSFAIKDLNAKLTKDNAYEENYLLTLQVKMKSLNVIRSISFILAANIDNDLLDIFRKPANSTKNKKATSTANTDTYILGSQNILPYLQNIGNGSSIYAILALDNEQKLNIPEPKGESNLKCLTLLNTLSRLKS